MTTKLTLLVLLLSGLVPTWAQEKAEPQTVDLSKIEAKRFMQLVRYPNFLDSWAHLKGTAHHKSKGKNFSVPIELRARFRKDEWRMQVVVNSAERYLVRQVPKDGIFGTTQICQKKAPAGGVKIQDLMIRPSDLTLAFLYWPLKQEMKPDTYKTIKCRVMELQHKKSGELARVWIAVEYLFPVRVQWFKANAKEPFRQLEFKGTKPIKSSTNKDRKLHMVQEVVIRNPGWKTRVKFTSIKGDEVTAKTPEPKGLMLPTTD